MLSTLSTSCSTRIYLSIQTGTAINSHPGNLHLRSLVDQSKHLPLEGSQKRKFARDIVQQIQSLQPAGRFLIEERVKTSVPKERVATKKKPSYNYGFNVHPTILAKKWSQASLDKAIIKVMQRMREKTTKQPCSEEPFLTHQDNNLCIYHNNEPISLSAPSNNIHIERDDIDNLLQSFQVDMFSTSELDRDTSLNEQTLREWIEKTKSRLNICGAGQSYQRILMYIKAALPIALKLVDILIEAENEERSGYVNPIPLDTINTGKKLSVGKCTLS